LKEDEKVIEMSKEKHSHGTGSEGGRRPTGDPVPTDTEVVAEPPKKRRLTLAYKLSVLAKVDELKGSSPNAVGEYLRSEGLYYSTVNKWRINQMNGVLSEHRKGSKGQIRESMSAENARLKRKLAATKKKLEQAELLIGLQKKISQIILADTPPNQKE